MKKMVIFLTAVVVLVLVLGIGMTVKAASFKETIEISKEKYRMMEEDYLEEVRDILLEKGCKNSGITLTYVTDAEGNRSYTVTVHHARLADMETQELKLLEARMQELAKVTLLTDVELKQLF